MRQGIVTAAGTATLLLAVCSSADAAWQCASRGGPVTNPATGKLEIDLGNCEGPGQAWIGVDGRTAVAFSDANADYWGAALPSLAGQSAHWEVRGAMPDARFSSLQTYTLAVAAEGMGTVSDENIKPDPGSVNWIQSGGRYPGAGRVRYTVEAVQAPASTPLPRSTVRIDRDKLAATPSHAALLAYRVYANRRPNGSTPDPGLTAEQWRRRGQVALPKLVYVIDDPARPHFTRAGQILTASTAALMGQAIGAGNAIGSRLAAASKPAMQRMTTRFPGLWSDPVRWELLTGLPKNVDRIINPRRYPAAAELWRRLARQIPGTTLGQNGESRYYMGGVNPALGDVLVTRFKAPTTPEPDRGDPLTPIARSATQLRYWSVCLYNLPLGDNSGCLRDSDFTPDADGYVTLTMSSAATPPIGPDGRPAANWMRHSSPLEMLGIRTTGASPTFTNSINFYRGADDDIAALKAWSGPYHPVSTYCTYAQYRADACKPV